VEFPVAEKLRKNKDYRTLPAEQKNTAAMWDAFKELIGDGCAHMFDEAIIVLLHKLFAVQRSYATDMWFAERLRAVR